MSKRPVVDAKLDESMRRMAWTNMLDPEQLKNTELSEVTQVVGGIGKHRLCLPAVTLVATPV